MAKIHNLKIKNFRGISDFDQTFFGRNFVCLIGRGDSGKSTILEAISSVLSPQWNLPFQDSDFTNCDTNTPIEIEATLIELPSKLIQDDKYGLYIRGVTPTCVSDELEDSHEIGLTIRLIVKKDLEPRWFVYNERQGRASISSTDRSKLNVFMVSDYVDRHFSWNRGNPLYALLKQEDSEERNDDEDDEDTVVTALREAKSKIDAHPFSELNVALKKVIDSAKILGIDISNAKNTLDFKELLGKESKLSLHESKIPFRLKGKGSKRLTSIAIQTALVDSGGIMLIDEIEQGLEPDRAQHLAKALKEGKVGQVFITTHSRDVVVELVTSDLFLVKSSENHLKTFSGNLQGALRKNPEAFFAKKVIICEGLTEMGICRALNKFKVSKGHSSAAVQGVRLADGTGSHIVEYTDGFIEVDYPTCLFCDSDVDKKDKKLSENKERLKKAGVLLVDWDQGDSLEVAITNNLPPDGVSALLELAARIKEEDHANLSTEDCTKAIWDSVKSKFGSHCPGEFSSDTDTKALRIAIGRAAGSGIGWFKNMEKGNRLGDLVFKYWEALPIDNKLKKQLCVLSEFIDGNGL